MGNSTARRVDETGGGSTGVADTRKVLRQPIGQQRAEFLRSCRARIQPADLGLPAPQRKRTEGLRREDVAALSGVSVAWYTWLEQGREMRVSDEVLERISHTFRLSEDEREYLFSLVQQRSPRLLPETDLAVPEEIVRAVEGVTLPALVMNLRWDLLYWNRQNAAVFRDYSQFPPEKRNLAELLFTGHSMHSDPVEFEAVAQRVLAKMRVDYSRAGNDPKFEALVRRLESISPQFRRMWRSADINVGSLGAYSFEHPVHGRLLFEHTSYVPVRHPTLRVTLCVPMDETSRLVLEAINREPPKSVVPSPGAG